MPSPPKVIYHDGIYFVTTGVEEGLMFPPNAIVVELLRKCLAQAQKLHPVHILHFAVSTTHIHLLLMVIDPQDFVDFMERFKTESSHVINRLLGRKKHTIWCEGYDSPMIEDLATVKDKIAYIYENAAKDGFVDSAEYYPGLSSWHHFKGLTARANSKKRYETRYLPRNAFSKLPEAALSEADYERLRRKLIHKRKKNHFEVDCNRWMIRLGITEPNEQHRINQQIISDVQAREAEHKAKREKLNIPVIGRKRLIERPIGTPYQPVREGKKMLIHSGDAELRRRRIGQLKALILKGRAVLERWRRGDMAASYPLGLFPPSGIRLAEPIGW